MAGSAQYIELADRLAARWSTLGPGTLVESEHRLAEEFGVNRLTAREAVRELERRMVVRRVMGRGTFTAHRLDYVVRLGGIASFHRNVEALGHTAETTVVSSSWTGRGERRRLCVERISYVDGFVASSATDSFPQHVGELLEERVADGSSIHDALSALGFDARRRSVQVAVEMPPSAVAAQLEFSSSVMPTWHLLSETVDLPSDRLVHQSDTWMRTDMFAVTVRLEREIPAAGV